MKTFTARVVMYITSQVSTRDLKRIKIFQTVLYPNFQKTFKILIKKNFFFFLFGKVMSTRAIGRVVSRE